MRGCTFILTKNLMTFLVITLSYMVINYLFISSAPRGAPHQIQPHFLPHSNKNA